MELVVGFEINAVMNEVVKVVDADDCCSLSKDTSGA